MTEGAQVLNNEPIRLPYFDWDKAKYFYYIAKLKNINEAAKFLNIAQPALSRKIIILEDHLNCKLFLRTPKGLEITRKGEELFAIIERVFLELKGFSYSASVSSNNGQKRKIRIATTHAIAAYILADSIFEYNKTHPELTFEIISDDHLLDVVLNEVDIAIRPFSPEAIGVEQDYLFTLQRKLYASEDYIKKHGKPENLEALKKHHIIAPARAEDFPYSDLKWILKLGMLPGEMHEPVFTSTLLECLVKAAKNGRGIIGAYEKMNLIKESNLVNVLPDIQDNPIQWFCTYAQSFKNDAQIRKIINYLRNNLK